jgi:hypothetical protein
LRLFDLDFHIFKGFTICPNKRRAIWFYFRALLFDTKVENFSIFAAPKSLPVWENDKIDKTCV